MKSMLITILISALGLAGLAPAARAAYDDVGVGARVSGLGSAYTAIADDVYAVYYNPAGLGTLDRPQLATTYSKLFMGLSDGSNLQNSFIAFENPVKRGRQGAYGLAWNYFALSGLYRESSLLGSYGRRIFAEALPGGLYAGATLKYLNRSLGNTGAADGSFTDTGMATNLPDPVLKKGSKSNYDADFGLLYRIRPRLTLGFTAQHLFEPNIAFSDSDTDALGRNLKFGGAYRTPWTSFAAELDLLKAPDGSTDKVGVLAFEKWLPTLMHGTFGIRTSVGAGSREYRQVTAGLSYRIYRLQADYSFTMPIGTVANTVGTHRMGLSFRFGRPTGAEPKFSEAVLENMRELADIGTPEFRAQAEDLALYKRTAQREFLRQARVDTVEGRFGDAAAKLDQALGMNPKDLKIGESLQAMKDIAGIYPEVRGFRTEPAEAAVYEGLMDYLAGRWERSVRKLAYAQTLLPGDRRVERMLQLAEAKSGVTRATPGVIPAVRTAPTMGAERVVGAKMALMEVGLRESDYARVVKLADEVLEVAPRNALAHKRKATALYAMKEYNKALESLRAAYKYEGQREERGRLKSYIDAMVSLIERKERESRERKARPAKPEPSRVDPVRVQSMYEAGVDLYAQGRLSEAANMFQSVLRLDPKNKSAAIALRRVQAELLRGTE